MTLDTITMDRDAARQAYREYQAAVRGDRRSERERWREEDRALMTTYRALAKGHAVLDVAAAIRTAGLREDGWPKLAIGRSDLPKIFCSLFHDGSVIFRSERPTWGWQRRKAERVELPAGTFARGTANTARSDVSTIVPIIPPALRPKAHLERFHTLWEVESWTLEPPKDPVLLRHLTGTLYAVLAVWDLTPLERAVLGSRAR